MPHSYKLLKLNLTKYSFVKRSIPLVNFLWFWIAFVINIPSCVLQILLYWFLPKKVVLKDDLSCSRIAIRH